jgi:EAL domain-containing protein (putative c-di-GMP-specific phosphodiesterase class I)
MTLYFRWHLFPPRRGRISGAEALIRWKNPEKGLIAPAEFIGVAGKSDLIIDIGKGVRQEAVRQLDSWSGGVSAHLIMPTSRRTLTG